MMQRRDRRKKLSEISPRRESFAKEYPAVETIRVEVRITGEGFEPFRNQKEYLDVFTEDHFEPIINCRNPLCYGGGLDVDRLVRYVVASKKTEYEDSELCAGYEGSPKGRRRYSSCNTFFKVKIAVTYKNS